MEVSFPRNVSELKSFLGMLNYYSKFLPNLSMCLTPLYALLLSLSWGAEQNKAFEQAKTLLTLSCILMHYDPSKVLVIAYNASQYRTGTVLSHKLGDEECLIAYASRFLAPDEKKYSQIGKEALTIVVGA